jgi:dihydroneopterin aldolase
MQDAPIADAARCLRHVFVRDLILQARIGAYPEEEKQTQRVRINIDLAVDDPGAEPGSALAVGADELDRVVNYLEIIAEIRRMAEREHIRLVETMAERIAALCLADARVKRARVRVEKPDIVPDAASVGVEIERYNAPS